MTRVVAAGLLLLLACERQVASPSEPSARAPIDPAQCQTLAQSHVDHCGGVELAPSLEYCNRLARLAEASGCVAQALRSFDCGISSIRSCTSKECCDKMEPTCTETNLPFDHCVRGYCTNHGGNPDCAKTFPPDEGTPAAGTGS